jgi:hypothetical protein
MRSHRRVVKGHSLSPDIAEEFKSIAKPEGKTVSGLFHEFIYMKLVLSQSKDWSYGGY